MDASFLAKSPVGQPTEQKTPPEFLRLADAAVSWVKQHCPRRIPDGWGYVGNHAFSHLLEEGSALFAANYNSYRAADLEAFDPDCSHEEDLKYETPPRIDNIANRVKSLDLLVSKEMFDDFEIPSGDRRYVENLLNLCSGYPGAVLCRLKQLHDGISKSPGYDEAVSHISFSDPWSVLDALKCLVKTDPTNSRASMYGPLNELAKATMFMAYCDNRFAQPLDIGLELRVFQIYAAAVAYLRKSQLPALLNLNTPDRMKWNGWAEKHWNS